MNLSKSDYMLFLSHPAWLWLKKHDPDRLPKVDASLQRIFDRGHDFESYAQEIFPDGVSLGFSNYNEYQSLLQKTKAEIEKGTKTIFQGRFEVDSITCIVDIIDRVGENEYDLIEVKSSTQAKPEHIPDLAFQTIVLEKAGLKIKSVSVMHVNNDFVRDGAIIADELVTRTDVTMEVREAIPETFISIDQALGVLSQNTIPDISPRYANPVALRDWLEVYAILRPELGKYSIYKLASRSIKQITELEDMGVTNMENIPDDFKLNPKQTAQVKCIKTNQRIIQPEPIKEFLNSLEYPLYFFDYETLGDLIPPFDGMKPYLQIPFQYSLHKIQKPDSKVEHFEFLSQDNTNPGKSLTKNLKNQIGQEGTVLVWYEGFEKNINLVVAEMLPDARDFYLKLNERIVDLMIPFSKGWFVDKDFYGSASIKKVQPVIAPQLSYKGLSIGNGEDAQRIWMETFLEGKNQEQKNQITKDLLTYCMYDTLVMVKIFEELQKAI